MHGELVVISHLMCNELARAVWFFLRLEIDCLISASIKKLSTNEQTISKIRNPVHGELAVISHLICNEQASAGLQLRQEAKENKFLLFAWSLALSETRIRLSKFLRL